MASHNALNSPNSYAVPAGFARHQTNADIVVSQPDGVIGGVCQDDWIKAKSGDRREREGFLSLPQADHERKKSKVSYLSSAGHDPRGLGEDTSPLHQRTQTVLSEVRARIPLPSGRRRPDGTGAPATNHATHAVGRRRQTQVGHDGRRLSGDERHDPRKLIGISAMQMKDPTQVPQYKKCLSQGSIPTSKANETIVAREDYRGTSPDPSTTALPQHLLKRDPTLEQQRDTLLSAFNCVFQFAGCGAAFAKKNEWKRHVATQHLLLNYWRCTEDACANRSYSPSSTSKTHPTIPPFSGSIFNRKDLFTQHLKRMHAPKEIKDLLNATGANTTKSSKKPSFHKPKPTVTEAALAKWNSRVLFLQSTAIHKRCTLPTRMGCPVPGCAEPEFCGSDAWNQRMEHVAQHIVAPRNGDSSATASEKVVLGGESDETLIDWASQPDVAIIEPQKGGGWVLKSPLGGVPGRSVVVTAPVQQAVFGENADFGRPSLLTKQWCANEPVEKKVSEAGTLAICQSNRIPAVERDTPDATTQEDNDTDIGDIEVPRDPELPEDNRAPMADMETQDNENTSQLPEEVVFIGSPGDNEQLGTVPTKDDIKMLDVRGRPSSSRHSLSFGPLTKARSSSGSFSAVNSTVRKAAHIPGKWKTPVASTNAADSTTKPLPLTAGFTKAAIESNAKRIKTITGPKITLSSPFPLCDDGRGRNIADTKEAASAEQPRKKIKITSRSSASGVTAAATDEDGPSSSGLEYDGYTSSDSISDDRLHPNDWRLHQVKTRTFATNPNVTQYWHWVTEKKKHDNVMEHQVLKSVEPIKWSTFKKPYNFHLKLGNIQEVLFARGSTRVVVTHKKKDMKPRGDVMAQFKRDRTKRRFLTFLRREHGVKIAEVGKDFIEGRWDVLNPETLSGPDSD